MNISEKNTVSKMIYLYCRSKHGKQENLCPECRQMEAYAHERLDSCPFGERKPVCKQCTIHCYKPEYRQKIREVMRFSGPRMLFYHPVDAFLHLRKN